MKNSNEHQVREILQPAELVKDLEDQIVNQLLDLLRSHHAHLKERVESLKKEPELPPDYENGYNDALNDVLKLLE